MKGIFFNGQKIFDSKPKIYGIRRKLTSSSPIWERTDSSTLFIYDKNLCPDFWELGQYNTKGQKESNNSRIRIPKLIEVTPLSVLYFNTFSEQYNFVIRTYSESQEFIRSIGAITNNATCELQETEKYISITMYNSNNNTNTEGKNMLNLIYSGDLKPFICLNDEENKEYIPYNNFNFIYPWSDIYTYSLNIETGEEIRYDDERFKYTDDYIFTRIPEFWWKREQKNGYEYIQIAEKQMDGFNKSETFSIGRYHISGTSSTITTKSATVPLKTTITDFRNYAKSLGEDFGLLDWRYFTILMLYLVEYANYDSQKILGTGKFASLYETVRFGDCDTIGMRSGSMSNDRKSSNIYRGIEDIYAAVDTFIDGFNIRYNYDTDVMQCYKCYEPSNYDIDKFNNGYVKLGYNLPVGYDVITRIGYNAKDPLIMLPKNVGDTLDYSTFICDGWDYVSSDNDPTLILEISATSDDAGGLFNFYGCFNNDKRGARLIRYK